MRILGIDPGLQLTGYGCVDLGSTQPDPVLVEAGVLRLQPDHSIASRIAQLHDDLTGLLMELKPDVMAVEKLFAHYRHPRTGVLMGHARGIVLLCAQSRGIRIREVASTEVKKSITGNGHASKHQMQQAIMARFGLREPPSPPDVADAIGIALCAARRLPVRR